MKPDVFKLPNNYYISAWFKNQTITSPAYCRTENNLSDDRTADHFRLQFTGTYVRNFIRNILKSKVWGLKCVKRTD